MKAIPLRVCAILASCCTLLLAPSSALADTAAPSLAELQRQVRELRDIESIKRVKHAYFRAIDSADLGLLASLLTPDVEVRFIGGDYDWKLKGRAEYVEAVGRNFNSQVIAEHNGHHPEITVLSDTEAEGVWYLHDNFYNLRTRLFTTGSAFYHDRYRKVDGQWRIASTRYERHYEIDTPLEKLPDIAVHYLGRHGRVVDRDCHTDALCRDAD
ncbi:MAG: nuclear transport factor 2 family protein [Proteobacteria bacterium]|nr:nuclear transport factor 2 family protein [Pseudomonadota bacterium]MBS0553466.1 nuclear transport factor 2 family protein [Pseudomonadota bacterium]